MLIRGAFGVHASHGGVGGVIQNSTGAFLAASQVLNSLCFMPTLRSRLNCVQIREA